MVDIFILLERLVEIGRGRDKLLKAGFLKLGCWGCWGLGMGMEMVCVEPHSPFRWLAPFINSADVVER